MARYKRPEVVTPALMEGEAQRDHYQLTLRKIRKWFLLSELDTPEANVFWRNLRDAERPLYRQGYSCDVSELEAVIESAHKLGYPSTNLTGMNQ